MVVVKSTDENSSSAPTPALEYIKSRLRNFCLKSGQIQKKSKRKKYSVNSGLYSFGCEILLYPKAMQK